MQNGTLSGTSAVVIGASSGIGLATANLFADAGATVHAAARRKGAIEEGAGGRNITAHELDISEEAAVRRVLEGIGESDGIDVLVVAAGMNFPERRLEQLTGESWDAMISVNLSGAFYAVRAALPYLRASQGLAVLVSSASGSSPRAPRPPPTPSPAPPPRPPGPRRPRQQRLRLLARRLGPRLPGFQGRHDGARPRRRLRGAPERRPPHRHPARHRGHPPPGHPPRTSPQRGPRGKLAGGGRRAGVPLPRHAP